MKRRIHLDDTRHRGDVDVVVEPSDDGFDVFFRPTPLIASANEDHSGSAMVAWYPSAAEAKQLQLTGGEDLAHLHCTLLYLGKSAEIDSDLALLVTGAVAGRFSPFTARVQGTAIFNTPDGDVLVRLVDAPELEQMQQRLHDEIAQGIDIPDNHGFTAHITLKYLNPGEAVDPEWFKMPPMDIVINSITTDFGTERTDFPLATEVTLGEAEGHAFRGNQWTGGNIDADAFVAAHPRLPGEAVFEWQSRIVAGLPEQQQSDIIFATRERYAPVGFIEDGIARWNEEHGLPPLRDDIVNTPVNLEEADAVAHIFEETPDQSGDPTVEAAYDDFRRQNEEMWDFMTRSEAEGGMGVKVDFTSEVNPYDTAFEQAHDLSQNHHIFLESGLGGEHGSTMTADEYDRFRAVHDVFGHAGIGSGFDRHGEYEAWLTHASMYTGSGRDAMSTEYHGVNSAAWTGEPGTPGTGKSILLPGEYADPPWERMGVTAAVSPSNRAIIDGLGLDAEWATKFSAMPWHTHAVVAAVQPLEFGDLEGHGFHGNQYTGGYGKQSDERAERRARVKAEREAREVDKLANSTAKSESRIRDVLPRALIDLGNMDHQEASHVADRIEAFAKDFPAAARSIDSVRMTDEPGTSAVAWVSKDDTYGTSNLALNARYYEDTFAGQAIRNEMQSFDYYQRNDGFHRYPMMEGTIEHELGHVLDNHVDNLASYTVDVAVKEGFEIVDGLGTYALRNAKEAFAEAFTQVRMDVCCPTPGIEQVVAAAMVAGSETDAARAFDKAWLASAVEEERTCEGFIRPEVMALFEQADE